MNPDELFALQDPRNGKWMTFDPAAEIYSDCNIKELKIWDVWDFTLAQYVSREKLVLSQGLIIKALTRESIELLPFKLL
jgi:hypothetical protein